MEITGGRRQSQVLVMRGRPVTTATCRKDLFAAVTLAASPLPYSQRPRSTCAVFPAATVTGVGDCTMIPFDRRPTSMYVPGGRTNRYEPLTTVVAEATIAEGTGVAGGVGMSVPRTTLTVPALGVSVIAAALIAGGIALSRTRRALPAIPPRPSTPGQRLLHLALPWGFLVFSVVVVHAPAPGRTCFPREGGRTSAPSRDSFCWRNRSSAYTSW